MSKTQKDRDNDSCDQSEASFLSFRAMTFAKVSFSAETFTQVGFNTRVWKDIKNSETSHQLFLRSATASFLSPI